MITGKVLTEYALNDEPIQLSSLFQRESVVSVEIPAKGLLIKENIEICDFSRDRLEARSTNISRFCTGLFNYPVFVKTNDKSLMCHLSDLMVYTGRLTLSDFRFMDQVWIERQYDRVQPKQPTFVSVKKDKAKTTASLFDLSQTGMSILIDKSCVPDLSMMLGIEYQVQVNFSPKDTPCFCKGRVVQVRPIANNLIKIGMDISSQKKDEKKIAQYLFDRKREILDELFKNFLELLNFRDTKDMYF